MTHLKIEQNTSSIEQVDNVVISKLYEFAESDLLDQSSNLQGRLHTAVTYQKFIDGIRNKYPELYITGDKYYLYIGDPVFTAILANAYGDGYGCVLSDFQNVTTYWQNVIAQKFVGNTQITDATGMKYFTSISWNNINNYHEGFRGCTNLQRIELPEGLPELSAGSTYNTSGFFRGCSSLEYVKLPSTLKKIDDHCFYQCSSLSSIELPYGLTSIGQSAFDQTNLSEIEIPETVTTLGGYAFSGSKLTSLHIPASVTTLQGDLVTGCPITSVTFDQSSGGNLTWNNNGMYGDGGLTQMGSPISITELDFPSRLIRLGEHFFRGCTQLARLIFRSTTPPTIDSSDFGFANTPTIYVPDSAVSTYQATPPYSNYTIHPISELSS